MGELQTWKHTQLQKGSSVSTLGDKQFLTVLDNLMGNVATIFVWDLDLGNIANTPDCPVHSMKGHTGKCSKALWGPLNETIFSASDDTTVRVWDPKTGTQKAVVEGHRQADHRHPVRVGHDALRHVEQGHVHPPLRDEDAHVAQGVPDRAPDQLGGDLAARLVPVPHLRRRPGRDERDDDGRAPGALRGLVLRPRLRRRARPDRRPLRPVQLPRVRAARPLVHERRRGRLRPDTALRRRVL